MLQSEAMAASNEHMWAVNEQLRSTVEELAARKEELQAVNDELHALNDELGNKLEEINGLNSKLQDLVTQRAEQIRQLTSELDSVRAGRAATNRTDPPRRVAAAVHRAPDVSAEQAAPLAEATTLIAQALNVTRTLTVELCPPVLTGEDADIAAKLDWLVLWMADTHRLRVEVASTCPVRVPAHVRYAALLRRRPRRSLRSPWRPPTWS